MKRITPEEVVAAYDKTGLSVARQEYFSDKGRCACGLGAYAAAFLGSNPMADEGFDVSRVLSDSGFGWLYRHGFGNGFDGDNRESSLTGHSEYQAGVKDGVAAWEAVKDRADGDDEVEEAES